MPVPKGKNSKQRRDNRAANKGLKPKAVAVCQTCNAAIATHQACFECGYYKGEKVLRTKSDRMHERGKIRKAKEEKIKARTPEAPEAPAGEAPEETKK